MGSTYCISFRPSDERHITGWTCYDTGHMRLMLQLFHCYEIKNAETLILKNLPGWNFTNNVEEVSYQIYNERRHNTGDISHNMNESYTLCPHYCRQNFGGIL
jgi:hypothetical protein